MDLKDQDPQMSVLQSHGLVHIQMYMYMIYMCVCTYRLLKFRVLVFERQEENNAEILNHTVVLKLAMTKESYCF